jgi:hypothetical protein
VFVPGEYLSEVRTAVSFIFRVVSGEITSSPFCTWPTPGLYDVSAFNSFLRCSCRFIGDVWIPIGIFSCLRGDVICAPAFANDDVRRAVLAGENSLLSSPQSIGPTPGFDVKMSNAFLERPTRGDDMDGPEA